MPVLFNHDILNPPHLLPILFNYSPRPSKTTHDNANAPDAVLAARQAATTTGFIVIPTTYSNLDNSLHPGVIAGIVVGSVAGFLLLLWLIYLLINATPAGSSAAATTVGGSSYVSRSVVSGAHSRPGRRKSRKRGSRVRETETETYEVRRGDRAPPPPSHPVIVEPPSVLTGSDLPPPPRPPVVPPQPYDEDEIIVEEEHSPPRRKSRHHSRRDSHRRSDESRRRESGQGNREYPDPDRDARRGKRYSRGP